MTCLVGEDVQEAIKKGHAPTHIRRNKLYEELDHLGYYWPTMEADCSDFVISYQPYQTHGNLIHASVPLPALLKPYPFQTWAFDLVGKITPHSRGKFGF